MTRALDRSAVAIARGPSGTVASPAWIPRSETCTLVPLAAVLIGASTADEIAVRLGLEVDEVAVLLAGLEEAGALTVVPKP